MQAKAQTMAQKFGFMDPDLTTPQHDAIMLWLDGEMEAIVNRFNPGWTTTATVNYRDVDNRHYRASDEMTEEAEKRAASMRGQLVAELSLDDTPRPIVGKTWELPIIDRTYTIGFCDMRVDWNFPHIHCKFDVTASRNNADRWSEPDTVAWQHTASMVAPTHFSNKAYFEVKPSIHSLGEVIRQIRMYQTYTRGDQYGDWWIVSPDARFRAQIEAQGIKFLTVPADVG